MTGRGRRILIGVVASAVIVTAVALVAVPRINEARRLQQELARGEELAGVYCASCHLEPSPDLLPKRSWETALGYMGYWLGMTNIDFLDGHPPFARENVLSRREVLAREGTLPAEPLLAENDWQALRRHYIENAPAAALPQTNKPALQWELPQFRIRDTDYRIQAAVTTLVRIRPERSEIYLGDSVSRILTVIGGDGRIKVTAQRFMPEATPVDIEFFPGMAYVASIGDLMATRPSLDKPAHILALPMTDGSIAGASAGATVAIDRLFRLADIDAADLNADGRTDFIVCGFGAVRGSVSWFEARPDGSFLEHVLLAQPGAVKAEAHDFNADGMLDVMALLSDAREGLHILVNGGAGRFEDRQVFETHPAYGHTYFELDDFDGDGRVDVLAVNGDNVDSDPYDTPKNYHGIRIYLNRGDYVFEEAFFYPMYGAFMARAEDFDADGDLDIAATSFYPDYGAERRESFVYLENRGGLAFDAFTSERLMQGRWMTMDAGDVDADGDVDVVLGGGYVPVGMFAYRELYESLARNGPAVLILENALR